MSIKHAICAGASKLWTATKVNSPTILIVSGVTGLVAAGVVACIETNKRFNTIMKEHKEQVQALKDIRDGKTIIKEHTTEEYANKYYRKDLTHAWLVTLCKFAKAYAPALGLGVLGIVAVLSGHKIITNRHLAAVAEVGLIKQTLSEYRKRVAEVVGDEREELIYLGGEKGIVSTTEIDPETGEEKQVSKEAIVGKEVPLSWTYIVSRETVNDALYGISDSDFRRQLDMLVNVGNQYFSRHDQITLHTLMSHYWKDSFMRTVPETINNGWLYNDQFISEGRDPDRAITYQVKVLNSDPDNRKYAVTFDVQCNIVDSLAAEKKQKRAERKMKRKVHAALRPAIA